RRRAHMCAPFHIETRRLRAIPGHREADGIGTLLDHSTQTNHSSRVVAWLPESGQKWHRSSF
ncbi:MAG: hypothetical protein KAQ74_00980, partial [Dehalococcoidia bacterium]|nr:hypothetical protein [Dehalococcoidia bacterium]